MFESSLVESSGQLRSKSSRYVAFTATFNVAAVAVMMLIPLLYPEALPRTFLRSTLTSPPPPPTAAPPRPAVISAVRPVAAMSAFVAPARIPAHGDSTQDPPPPSAGVVIGTGMSGLGGSNGDGMPGALGLAPAPPVLVKPAPVKPNALAHISGGVIAGNKVSGATPVYPAIARAAHVSGAVVLHAIVSRTGDIESLSVVSGPEMLRAGAVAAVQSWKYRPYLLSGEPTAVDTTITVNFTFGS